MKMFAVYDIKAEAYLTPFFMLSIGQAVRAFSDLVGDKSTIVGKHPDDYKLVHVADFDVMSGEVSPAGLVSLGFGSSFISKEEAMAMRSVL